MIILNIDILYIEFWYDDVNFGILIFKLYIMIILSIDIMCFDMMNIENYEMFFLVKCFYLFNIGFLILLIVVMDEIIW